MNRYIFIITLLIPCLILTGCWNYREIDSLYIIAGVAIDKVPDTDQYAITIEFVNIKENKSDEGYESILLEITGDSIADAVTNTIRVSAKTPYWGHTTTMIISQEVAEEGIMSFLDLFLRDQDSRLGINVYIAKNTSAKKILETTSLSTDIKSFEINIMATENKHLIKVPVLKIYEIINKLSIPKVHMVLPTIELFSNQGEDTSLLAGGGVFSMGKLVGFLKEDELIPYLYITDQVEAGIINVETGKDNPKNRIILDIWKSNTKLTPTYEDEEIIFDISINTDTSISELFTMTDYISIPGRTELKSLTEQTLDNQIKNHIRYVQKEFGFDIFGFGNVIRQRNPNLWKTLEDDWDNIFKDMKFNIDSNVTIKNSGQNLKPIKVVD